MALKPNDGETFLKEVDDELRRERVSTFVSRYGWWLIAAVLLLLGAVGGWIWWSGRQAGAREAAGQNLVDALVQLERGQPQERAAAAPALGTLAQSDVEGYRAAALFARANSETQAGNTPAAIATLRTIAADPSLDQAYRDAALVRQTALEFDTLQPREVIRRLGPLAAPGSAWIGGAGEMVGVAHLRMNRPDLAGPVFVRIARQAGVPASIKARAAQMAGSLGFDVNAAAARNTAPRPTAAVPATAPATGPATGPASGPATAPATREKAR